MIGYERMPRASTLIIGNPFQSNAELQGKIAELEGLIEELQNTKKTSKLIEVRGSFALPHLHVG